jgi:hypothetical protein
LALSLTARLVSPKSLPEAFEAASIQELTSRMALASSLPEVLYGSTVAATGTMRPRSASAYIASRLRLTESAVRP